MRLKKLLAMLLTVVLLVSSTVIALPVSADGGDTAPAWEYKDGTLTGSGTQESPYIIATAQDLATLAYKVNNNLNNDGTTRSINDNFSMHQYFKQTADIDLDNIPWQVIGRNDGKYRFCGSYDGDGYAIKNLKIENITGLSSYGLFGYTAFRNASAATEIKNVNIVSGNISVSGAQYVGALVGYVYNGATITNCSNMASVTVTNMNTSDSSFGGLVGALNAGTALDIEVANCYNGADVTVTSTSTSKININIGGMFGDVQAYSGASFTNCINYGKVTLTNDSFANNVRAGGVIGYLNSMGGAWNWNSTGAKVTMTNVSNVADVTLNECGDTPNSETRMGSLVGFLKVGQNDSAKGTLTVNGCFASGKLISTTAQKVGAVARAYASNVSVPEGGSTNYFSYEVTPTASATANYVFTEGTKDIDISALSMLPTGTIGAQYKTEGSDFCVRFAAELNVANFAGIKDVGFLVTMTYDGTTHSDKKLSGNNTVYTSLNALNGEKVEPNGVGYLIAAGIKGVPTDKDVTFTVKPYVEFEDGTLAYGTASNAVTFVNGAVKPAQ